VPRVSSPNIACPSPPVFDGTCDSGSRSLQHLASNREAPNIHSGRARGRQAVEVRLTTACRRQCKRTHIADERALCAGSKPGNVPRSANPGTTRSGGARLFDVSSPPRTSDDLPGIGAPATRALASVGVTRLSQLVDYRKEDLLALHGFGPSALRILEASLSAAGLKLR
jgi:hypothetical protein